MAVKFTESFRKGNIFTKLSILIPGLGNLVGKQIIKGIMYIAIEAAFVCFMIMKGINCLAMLSGLGSRPQQEVWNEKLGIYEYVAGDNSLLILLYGIATIFMIIAYIIVAAGAVKSSYKLELLKEKGKHINTFAEDMKSLFNENLHKLLLTLPVSGVLIFTILPLIFMISMAFTNYSKVNNHLVLFDWVGLENFKQIFDSGSMIGQSFWSVFGWTIVWAVFATFLNYIFGILVALLINRYEIQGLLEICIYTFNCNSTVCFTSYCQKHAGTGWNYKCCFKECRLDNKITAILYKCDLGKNHSNRGKSVDRYSIYYSAGYRYITEYTYGVV